MSREKQIEEMAIILTQSGCVERCADCDCYQKILPTNIMSCETMKIATDLYNAGYRKQSEWISVDERLPEKWQRVLVNYNGNVCVSWQNANGTWFECWNDKVTHWMPLPEAPKMKGGAE